MMKRWVCWNHKQFCLGKVELKVMVPHFVALCASRDSLRMGKITFQVCMSVTQEVLQIS